MLHIVQFSGGAASSYVAKLVAEEHPDNTILFFHDTKAEHPDAYRFRRQVAEYIGLPITEVSDGRSLWEVIYDEHCIPQERMGFCSRILKIEQAEKYYKNLHESGEEFVLYNGFGITEWSRVQKATIRAELSGHKARSLLCERMIPDYVVKQTIRDRWRICLPETYKHLKHNNCIPCFKGGKGHFFKVWKYYPEQFAKALQAEKDIGYTVFEDISLEELVEKWRVTENQNEFDQWEEESMPCMCAI